VKNQALTPFILFAFAVALPACLDGEPPMTGVTYESLIAPPASCSTLDPSNVDPSCNVAVDVPSQFDLTISNSQNLVFSTTDGALTLNAGSGSLVDEDGDGVPDQADDCLGEPGWRSPCDGDPSNDGIYQTLYFNSDSDVTVQADVDVSGKIEKADAYVLMDATGSMRGEQTQLVIDLTTGDFVDDPTLCPSGVGTGLLGALQCAIPDLWIGVGDFKEVSYLPHNDRYVMAPYHHYLDMTDDVQHVVDAVSNFVADSNKDYPEATTQALYSVVTGQGLGDLVPNRGSCPSTPAGRWGYPCFRPNVLPIIVLVTDADMWNGPVNNGHTYGNPPYDGTVGLGTRLPPVEQSPNILYSNNPSTAWDLGDLTNRSLTLMGSNVNLGDNAQTYNKFACSQCGTGCWSDGRDAIVSFSLSGLTEMFVSGEGTAYHTTNVAIMNSGLGFLDCNPGPGGGDYWGRLTQSLGVGDWYAVSDASVEPSKLVEDRIGDFQLRLHNLTVDPVGHPSWQTADLPIPWTTVETELLAAGVKIVNVISPNTEGLIAKPDVRALAVATNSLDQFGNPYLEEIEADGSGLSVAILDAVRSLVGDTRRDISIVAEDNSSTAGVDESDFVTAVTATSCPTAGIQNCLGGQGTSSCQGCLADTQIGFSFRLGNDIVTPLASMPQVFEFDMVALADGTAELARIPVRVMVPEDGTSYGAGFYENSYDSGVVCRLPPEIPSERPDWGTLTWTGSTPSDSRIVFEFFTGDTLAELDSQIPASVTYAGDISVPNPPVQTYDIDVPSALMTGNKENYRLYLRVRARLEASSDTDSTPIFEGWAMEFHCIEHE